MEMGSELSKTAIHVYERTKSLVFLMWKEIIALARSLFLLPNIRPSIARESALWTQRRLQSNGCKVVACLQRQENPGLFAGSIPMASVEHYQFCAEEVKSLTILPKVLFFAALEYIELGICISGYGSSQSCKICLVVSAMDSIQLNMILSSL